LIKNIAILYYLKQPLIDLNKIMVNSENQKENTNEIMVKARIKILENKLIKNKEEYKKILTVLYGKNQLEKYKLKELKKEKRKYFNFINYKRLRWHFMKLNTQILYAKLFNVNSKIMNCKFLLDYYKIIILNDYFRKKLEKILKDNWSSSNILILKNGMLTAESQNTKNKIKLNLIKNNKNEKNIDPKLSYINDIYSDIKVISYELVEKNKYFEGLNPARVCIANIFSGPIEIYNEVPRNLPYYKLIQESDLGNFLYDFASDNSYKEENINWLDLIKSL
jgi:hypothetical protein